MQAHHNKRVQELRGIAVIFVIFYHVGGLIPAGFIGVDVFFVLSGYVITISIRRGLHDGSFSIGEFLRRRVRRIVPALAVMLLVTLLLATWMSSIATREQTVKTGLFAALGLANLFQYRFRPDNYFAAAEQVNALQHTWSLSLEEQMYLGAATVVFCVVRVVKRQELSFQFTKISVTTAALVSLIFCLAVSHVGIALPFYPLRQVFGAGRLDGTFGFFSPLTRAWEFMAGALVAMSGSLCSRRPSHAGWKSLSLCMILVAGLFANKESFPNVWSLLPVVGASILLSESDEIILRQRKLSKLLCGIGDRSYSLYLWHYPMIQFAAPYSSSRPWLLAATLGAALPAEFSYRYIEGPIRSGHRWRSKKGTIALLATSVVLPLLAMSLSRNPEPDLDLHLDANADCDYRRLERLAAGGPCRTGESESGKLLALVGDSHAGHLSEGFISAATALGYDAVLATLPATPFLIANGGVHSDSGSSQLRLVRYLIESDVEVVVISQANYGSWTVGMSPILRLLSEADIAVVLVAEFMNVNEGANPQHCSGLQIRIRLCPADVTNLSESLLRARVREEEELSMVANFRRVTRFDWFPYLCPHASCPVRQNGRWIWRDDGHISVYASEKLSAPLQRAIQLALNA